MGAIEENTGGSIDVGDPGFISENTADNETFKENDNNNNFSENDFTLHIMNIITSDKCSKTELETYLYNNDCTNLTVSSVVNLLNVCVKHDNVTYFRVLLEYKELKRKIFVSMESSVLQLMISILSSDLSYKYLKYVFTFTGLTVQLLKTYNPLLMCAWTSNTGIKTINKLLTLFNVGPGDVQKNDFHILLYCATHCHYGFMKLWNILFEDPSYNATKLLKLNLSEALDKLMNSSYSSKYQTMALSKIINSEHYNLCVYNTCTLDLLTFSVYSGDNELLNDVIRCTKGLTTSHIKNSNLSVFTYAAKSNNVEIINTLASFYNLSDFIEKKTDIHKVINFFISSN